MMLVMENNDGTGRYDNDQMMTRNIKNISVCRL